MATEGRLRRAFAVFDADGSGHLSADELLSILTRSPTEDAATLTAEEAQGLVDSMDQDGDGMVSLEEVVEGWSDLGIAVPEAAASEPEAVPTETLFKDVEHGKIWAVHGEGVERRYDIVDEDVDCFFHGVPYQNLYDDAFARPPQMLEVGDPCVARVVDKYAMRKAGVRMPPDGWASLY
jgi:hypothetical protein